jgi:hypothetical protein
LWPGGWWGAKQKKEEEEGKTKKVCWDLTWWSRAPLQMDPRSEASCKYYRPTYFFLLFFLLLLSSFCLPSLMICLGSYSAFALGLGCERARALRASERARAGQEDRCSSGRYPVGKR